MGTLSDLPKMIHNVFFCIVADNWECLMGSLRFFMHVFFFAFFTKKKINFFLSIVYVVKRYFFLQKTRKKKMQKKTIFVLFVKWVATFSLFLRFFSKKYDFFPYRRQQQKLDKKKFFYDIRIHFFLKKMVKKVFLVLLKMLFCIR